MDTIYWRMNATQGGANLLPDVNLLPGANLHPGAICAHKHGFKQGSVSMARAFFPTPFRPHGRRGFNMCLIGTHYIFLFVSSVYTIRVLCFQTIFACV